VTKVTFYVGRHLPRPLAYRLPGDKKRFFHPRAFGRAARFGNPCSSQQHTKSSSETWLYPFNPSESIRPFSIKKRVIYQKTSAQFKIPSGYQILYALENHIGIFMDVFIYESARRIEDQNVLRKVDALMDWSLVYHF